MLKRSTQWINLANYYTKSIIDRIIKNNLEYHKNYSIPNNVYIVVIGDVNYKDTKKLLANKFGSWTKGKVIENPAPVLTENVALTEINFVDLPSATQSSITVTNNVDLKMSDEDYFIALMTNDILGLRRCSA